MREIMQRAAVADERPRFLSEADCRDVAQRLARFSKGGGYTGMWITSTWIGNLRWARNQITTLGEVSNNAIRVQRGIRGATERVELNDTIDAALMAAARRAERLLTLDPEQPNSDLISRLPLEPSTKPQIFSESTSQLSAEQRVAAALTLAQQAAVTGMLSAGYIEVAAVGLGILDSRGRVRYAAYTQARYSVTVRDPEKSGSGWAGVDWYDWAKIDAPTLTARALDKCLRSRNPVAIEPGRYTTILEPQAVCDFVGPLVHGIDLAFFGNGLDRSGNEGGSPPGPFLRTRPNGDQPGYAKLGEKVVDERITISADPMDPELGFPPFGFYGYGFDDDPFVTPVYHPTTWIEHGVLVNLASGRLFEGIRTDKALGRDENLGMPNSGAFRMSGGDTSVDEMIETTKRGLLVTRFDNILELDLTSQLYRGYTRDGVWLIENGKISTPVKNLIFTESIMFALNNVEQLGQPQRVFHPTTMFRLGDSPQPVVVPPLKIRDFSFTALSDAV